MNSLPERFWAKVLKTPDGCWIWIAARNKLGYGIFGIGRKSILAHRLAFEERYGKIIPGMLIRHSCDTPACVNPSHLMSGSDKDNMRDSMERNRRANFSGERNGRAKVNSQQVKDLREKYVPGMAKIVDLAREYGISKSQVWNIVSSREWNEFPEMK